MNGKDHLILPSKIKFEIKDELRARKLQRIAHRDKTNVSIFHCPPTSCRITIFLFHVFRCHLNLSLNR